MAVRQLSKSTIAQGLPRGSKFWDGVSSINGFELIQTTILTSPQTSVTFDVSAYTSLYKHLQVRTAVRGTLNYDMYGYIVRFNNDSGNNYARHILWGNGSSTGTDQASTTSYMNGGYIPGAQAAANIFTSQIIDVADAFNTNKYKTIKLFTGTSSATREVDFASGLWMNTNAVTSVTLEGSYATNSRFSIYGIKG